jgi:hypothetical protein
MVFERMGIDPNLALLASLVALGGPGIYLGCKLLVRGSHLLAYEFLVMGVSSINTFIYAFTGSAFSYDVLLWLEIFGRVFGFPLLVTLGLGTLISDLKLSTVTKNVIFAISLVLSLALLMSGHSQSLVMHYIYLILSLIFAVFLFYFAKSLFLYGKTGAGSLLAIIAVASVLTVFMYDFFTIPGDDDKMEFYTIASFFWALLLVSVYWAFVAMTDARTAEND